MDDLTRLALVAAEGDRVALTAFVRQTQADVWRLCSRLGDAGSADDLTQDVYLRALPALRRFRGESSARTWLLQIARHVCADHVRSATRRRALRDRLVARQTADASVTRDHSGGVEIDAAVLELEPDRRTAFVLTQVIGLSYQEAAAVCEVPVGTIRSRVARARADLLDAITASPGERSAGDA